MYAFDLALTQVCLPVLIVVGFDSTVTWNDETHTNAAHQAVTSMGKVVKELAQAKGVDLPFIFQNDANHDQSPLRTYPAENLAKLKAASLKYDPKQVFQTLQGDGFLLSKA